MIARETCGALTTRVHVVEGFKKSSTPTIHHEMVTEILSRYVPREKIIATIDPLGKPQLAPVDGVPIHIGLSHVQDVVFVALAFDGPVGIDGEIIRPRRYLTEIAARYFAEEQPKNLIKFYRAWTAREAFIKCIGSRISLSLARIRTKPCEDRMMIGLDDDFDHTVQFLTPSAGVMIALCRPRAASLDYAVIMS